MGRRNVAIPLEDLDPHRDDILWQIDDEQHIGVHETGVSDEGLNVGAWEDSHLPPCTIEVGSDPVLMMQLCFRKVDVAECGRAGSGGNVEHDVVSRWRLLGEGGLLQRESIK